MLTRSLSGSPRSSVGKSAHAIAAAFLAGSLAAQAWSVPFNHNSPMPVSGGGAVHGNFTNPFTPWGAVPNNTLQLPPGVTFFPAYGWPLPATADGPSFNAVHMALIPKGPYQGKILVWDLYPTDGKEPAASGLPQLAPNDYRSFQAYSIIDPDPALPSTQFRYRNFLLPMPGIYTPNLLDNTDEDGEGLFCAGHTWSPFGDLVVVGGTIFTPQFKGSKRRVRPQPRPALGTVPRHVVGSLRRRRLLAKQRAGVGGPSLVSDRHAHLPPSKGSGRVPIA
jgi:hypothetical protein